MHGPAPWSTLPGPFAIVLASTLCKAHAQDIAYSTLELLCVWQGAAGLLHSAQAAAAAEHAAAEAVCCVAWPAQLS